MIIAGWLREIRHCTSTFVLDNEVKSDRIPRTRSLLQGDPAAPAIFNAALDIPAGRFCKHARRKGWGIQLENGTNVSLILFADNFWVLAKSAQELSETTTYWLSLLQSHGWDVPLDEAVWCTTSPDGNTGLRVDVQGTNIKRAKRGRWFRRIRSPSCI